jgi:peptidoglycan/LPS O-acetylase OafA/YrhL
MFQFISDLPHLLQRRTTAGSLYRPEIDGLRFFAILMVVIGHMSERIIRFLEPVSQPSHFDSIVIHTLANPGSGVTLFFSVSGFIIANQYLRKKPMPFDCTYLKSYFLRRILRIEPPYFIVLLGTYFLLTTTGFVPEGLHRFNVEPASLTTSLIASLFYYHSPYYGTLPRLFGPGWSLEIEVQFYILAPIFFTILYFVKNELFRRLAEAGLLIVGFFAAANWASLQPDQTAPIYLKYTLVHFFAHFWLGVIFADNQLSIRATASKMPTSVMQILPWIGVAFIFLSDSVFPNMNTIALLMQLIGVALAFFGALHEKTSFRKFCSLPWISLIGGACYSIYLTHLQFLHIAEKILIKLLHLENWMATLAISTFVLVPLVFVIGLVFYAAIERLFMIPDWPRQFWQFANIKLRRQIV